MLGLVFTEFQEFIEEKFSPELYDDLVAECSHLESGGAYTSVGQYPYEEMVELVLALSDKLDAEVPDLIKTFGHHLFHRFTVLYPAFFEDIDDSFELLQIIEDHIHVEVKKLYPHAELPSFDCSGQHTNDLTLIYTSQRPFADLAEGLMMGCVEFYKQDIIIDREDLVATTYFQTKFVLKKQ